jgi:hypothetical protein
MSIVNSILNLVDLNTTKYTKKLKSMKKDTKAASKSMAQNFASIGSAWKAAIAGIAAGALTGAISKELMATEKSVASFITATGSLQEARAQFEMLQQAARDTIQPFDALKAVTLDLRKNGIQATAEQLKTFSQIAYGTGQSLETVGKAFTATMQGRYKALQQLGITAKDNGAALLLTYKGITTEVEKNSEALGAYFAQIGKENEGVLDYLQGGMTGAVNQLENAWGDFYRAIAESGLGDLIAKMVRTAADALDGITAWINENRPYFQEFFSQIGQAFSDIVGVIKSATSAGLRYIAEFFGDSEDEAQGAISNIGFFLSNFFNFARKGFLEYVAKPAAISWEAIKGGFESVSDYLGTLAYTGSFDEAANAYDRTLNRTADSIADTSKLYDAAIQLQIDDIDKSRKRLIDKLKEKPDEGATVTMPKIEFGTLGGTAGGRKQAEDNWAQYYTRVLQLQRNGYTEAQKLRAEHNDALEELLAEYQASATATEAELFTARAALDADYQRKIKEQRDAAVEYLRELRGDELEQLTEEYRGKLEQLDQYHADALISEQEYQEARLKLINDYEKARTTARASKNEFITAEDQENVQLFTDSMNSLSDAFQNLTTGMSESSGAYKALFAIQKSFAVASATANAIVAWTKALSTSVSWYEALANYANAVALTTNVIGQLKSLTMHDLGGHIAAGQVGVVGEYGPELVTGPADVTSRRRTAELARQAAGGTAGAVTVNLYEDAAKAGQVETGDDQEGERVINIFVSNIRRGGAAARAMESTYQLRRYGA